MEDQIQHEEKRHENLKKIIIQEYTKGESTFNASMSAGSKKILEQLEQKKENTMKND